MHKHARRTLLLAAAISAVAVAPASAATKSVSIDDFAFSPASLSVSKGTKVVWNFDDSATHNVTVRSGPKRFHSQDKRSGSFSKKLKKAGTYKIFCSIHPDMKQTITVR